MEIFIVMLLKVRVVYKPNMEIKELLKCAWHDIVTFISRYIQGSYRHDCAKFKDF